MIGIINLLDEVMSEEKYFNFPIQLLDGFLVNSNKCLSDLLYYSLYTHTFKLEYNDEMSKFKAAAKFYNVKIRDIKRAEEIGEELFNSIPLKSPKVGLNLAMYWDYHDNHKTEFEKVCLLGFLAIKSIVQNKAYCKITNKYWLSRMDGNTCSIKDDLELSDEINKYNNEYQTKKIKTELMLNWNLITYSRFTRGFYVSFKLDIEKLVFEAEKKRKSTRLKQHKFAVKLALEKANARLQDKPP